MDQGFILWAQGRDGDKDRRRQTDRETDIYSQTETETERALINFLSRALSMASKQTQTMPIALDNKQIDE